MSIVQWYKSDGFRCRWVSEPGLEIYARKGRRLRPDLAGMISSLSKEDLVITLDIASVNAAEPGQGSWSALAARLPEIAKELMVDAVYVENVLEPRFQEWFERRGWLSDKRNLIPCYWMFCKE